MFGKNNRIRKKVYQSVDGLTDEQFNKIPTNGGWSPKQIFEHLVRMETLIATKIAEELKNPDSPKCTKKPLALTSGRLLKVEEPADTVPTEVYKSIVEMKNELYESRLFLLDVYESATMDVLCEKSFKHPHLGQVPLIQWFSFVGLHEKWHLKQLKKTLEMTAK